MALAIELRRPYLVHERRLAEVLTFRTVSRLPGNPSAQSGTAPATVPPRLARHGEVVGIPVSLKVSIVANQVAQPFGVGSFKLHVALDHGNGLEALRPHDSTKPAAAAGVLVRQNTGHDNQVLSGLPAGHHIHSLSQFGFEMLPRFNSPTTPQVRRITDFGSTLVNKDIDRFLGPALHDDAVVPSGFQRDAPRASQVAVAEMLRACGRGLATNHPP